MIERASEGIIKAVLVTRDRFFWKGRGGVGLCRLLDIENELSNKKFFKVRLFFPFPPPPPPPPVLVLARPDSEKGCSSRQIYISFLPWRMSLLHAVILFCSFSSNSSERKKLQPGPAARSKSCVKINDVSAFVVFSLEFFSCVEWTVCSCRQGNNKPIERICRVPASRIQIYT